MGGAPPPHPSRPIGSVKCDSKMPQEDEHVLVTFSGDGMSITVTLTMEQAEYYSEGQNYVLSIA